MQLRIIFPLRFTTGVSGWIVIWGSSQEYHISTVCRCKIEQPDTDNIIG